jgi:hypothetical protein
MAKRLRIRVTIETGLAIISLLLVVLTLISDMWIETLTGIEPDDGSGALEWGIVAVFAIAAVASSTLAWRDARRLRTAAG